MKTKVQLSLCKSCGLMTWTLCDEDGNRECGKCGEEKPFGV